VGGREHRVTNADNPDVETASEGYAKRFGGAIGAWMLAEQSRAVDELLRGLPTGARVLDVGGGHAQLTPGLVARGFRVVVLGSSPDAAGSRLQPYLRDGRASFEVGSLTSLPFDAGTFDAVVSVRLLPHLPAWRAFVADACRVAKRHVIVDYPSIHSVNRFADATFAWKKRVEGNTRTFTLFDTADVARALEGAGFRVCEMRHQFLFPMVLHRMHGVPGLGRTLEAPGRWLGLTRRWGSPIVARADRTAGGQS
jgi:SAM-dependent methyltransferase